MMSGACGVGPTGQVQGQERRAGTHGITRARCTNLIDNWKKPKQHNCSTRSNHIMLHAYQLLTYTNCKPLFLPKGERCFFFLPKLPNSFPLTTANSIYVCIKMTPGFCFLPCLCPMPSSSQLAAVPRAAVGADDWRGRASDWAYPESGLTHMAS